VHGTILTGEDDAS